jgi:osmotically-inducible protein OsmY
MTRKYFGIAASVGALMLLALTSAAQESKSTGQQLKEKAGEAAQAVKKGVSSAEDAIKRQYESARAGVHNLGVDMRVYGRLHWDKALHDSKIDTTVQQNGVVTLRGMVPDAKAKAKAVELAADTVGVTQVVDLLTTPQPTAAPAKTQ